MSETDFVHMAISALNALPCTLVWRNNSGQRGGVRFGKAGSADIVGIVKGRFFAVEYKTEDGKLSEKQAEFITKVNALGGYACVCRTRDDVMMHWRQCLNGVQKRLVTTA
jgi:hypothetical protein